jgi:type VI secretion system secreted protein VgrG
MPRDHVEVRLESTRFSCDRLEIRELFGRERLNQLFSFDAKLVNLDKDALDARDLAGAPVSLIFFEGDVELRRIHGMIAEATDLLDTESDHSSYRARIVPRAHRSTLVKTQEIFLDVTIPDVLGKKLGLVGLADDMELRLLPGADKRYPVREFVVQYGETDLDFLSRLVEHVGVSFFFDHTGGSDRIVFTDHNQGFPPTEDGGRIPFRSRGEQRDLYRLEVTARIIPSFYSVSDYNYEKPLVDMTSITEDPNGYGGGVVEFGSNFKEPEEGAVLARVRAEERAATSFVFEGESDRCTLSAGVRFVVEGHPRMQELGLLVIEVEHRLRQVSFGGGDDTEQRYSNVFRAIPADRPYRPQRVTPRPRIHGIVSGIVESAPGNDLERPWIDEHGRYLVRVLFDTAERGERKASLPIRMAQAHAGPNYGIHFPLRPGVEVLLAFTDGDPDRPVIVGSVPNAVTPAPVVDREALYHRIRTSSGVLIEIDDGR